MEVLIRGEKRGVGKRSWKRACLLGEGPWRREKKRGEGGVWHEMYVVCVWVDGRVAVVLV